MGRRLLVAIAAVIAAHLPTAHVEAHAGLASSTPADGEVVAEAVESVSLTFTESVQPSAVGYTVMLGEGAELPNSATSADGTTWTLTFEPVHVGAVTVAYDVISVDGHVITGTLTFTVDAPAPPTTPAPPPATMPEPATETTGSDAPSTTAVSSTTAAATDSTVVAVAAPPTVTAPDVVADQVVTDDDGTSPVVWVLVLGAAVALVGVIAWSATRRGDT